MKTLEVLGSLGVTALVAWGTQSCKSPADSFECHADVECDLPRGGGRCVEGQCRYDSRGSGGSNSGGSNGTGGSSGTGDGGASAGGDASAGGASGSRGTGSAPGTDPDGGERGDELTLVAGTIGGKGSIDGIGSLARFMSPACLAYDGKQFVYVGDVEAETIRRFDTRTGEVITVAGETFGTGYVDGKGSDARFTKPECVHYDGTDPQKPVLYVSEWEGHRIRKIDIADGHAVSLVAGSTDGYSGYSDATGEAAQLNAPVAMVRRGNLLYVADARNNALRSINLTTRAVGTVIGVVGQADKGDTDGPIAIARLNNPHALALSPDGKTLYIGEHDGMRVRVLDLTTNVVSTLATTSGNITSLAYLPGTEPHLVATLYPQKRILDVNIATKNVANLAGNGEFAEADGLPAAASFRGPHGVVVMPDGSLFVAAADGPTIRRLAPEGGVYRTTTFAGAPVRTGKDDGPGKDARFESTGDMVVAPDQNTIYVLDGVRENCAIRTFAIDSRAVGTFAGGSECAFADGVGGAARFDWPSAMTAGVAAPGGTPPLFVAEQKGVVRRVDTSTKAVTHLNDPVADGLLWRGIAATSTTIYVSGESRRKIYGLSVGGGALGEYAGTGEESCTDGPAAVATFKSPAGLLWDGAGFLYVADPACGSIRRIDLTTNMVVTVAGGNQDQDEDPDGFGRGAAFGYPAALGWDRDRKGFYVQDIHMVRWVDATTFEVKTILGVPSLQGGVWLPPSPPRVNFPGGFIQGRDGELYISSESAILRWGK